MLGTNQVIDQVLELWRTRKSDDDFGDKLMAQGWKLPPISARGGFKTAYLKDGLCVKHSDVKECRHTEVEWRIWRRASSYKRRFLARCYIYKSGLLIQQRVKQCAKQYDCKVAERWAQKLRILDWEINHGHRPNGMPVFFDYDVHGET